MPPSAAIPLEPMRAVIEADADLEQGGMVYTARACFPVFQYMFVKQTFN